MIIPVILSVSGIIAVLFYERWTAPPRRAFKQAESLGFVQSSKGFHLRRKHQSRMWEPVQVGDTIYPRDVIKTGSQGELTISLPVVGKSLDLESDSLIVIEANSQLVTLRAFDGYFSLLPQQQNAAKKRLRLADGQSAQLLDVPAEMASYLKVANKPLQKINFATEKLARYENIQWKSPEAEAQLELNPDLPQNHVFSWEGHSSKWGIQIEWGPSRRRLPNSKSAASAQKTIEVLLPIGKHFWRWNVIDKATQKPIWSSPTARLVVQGLFPPSIIGPIAERIVRVDAPTSSVTLQWTNDKRFSQYFVELGADENLSTIIYRSPAIKGSEAPVQPGRYGIFYWRLIGVEAASKRSVSTKSHAFKMLPKLVEKIEMQWITQNDSTQYFVGQSPQLALAWSSNARIAKTYKVKIVPVDGELGRTIQTTETTSKVTLPLDRPGTYQVTVDAFNAESDTVGSLPPLKVSVMLMPTLPAPALVADKLDANAKGEIVLQWKSITGANEYQIEIKTPEGKTFYQATKTPELELKKLMPGVYNFNVMAIDQFGRPSARSPAGRITVPEKSFLKGPSLRRMEVE